MLRRDAISVLFAAASAASCRRSRPVPPSEVQGEARLLWERALGTRARNPAPAIVVSRVQFEKLPAIQSWLDIGSLRDYCNWADRWESAGFENGRLAADLGPYDAILLRRPAAALAPAVALAPDAGWKADPVGFAVFLPPGPGRIELSVPLTGGTHSIPPQDLPLDPVPVIEAAVYAGEDTVVLYGTFPESGELTVQSRTGPAEILYRSPHQINVRAPGATELRVNRARFHSGWEVVQQ